MPRTTRQYVWIEGDNLCAEMPALIFFSDAFEPMWKQKKAIVKHGENNDVVCIPLPRVPAIIRSGRGWGRRGNDKYYLFYPPDTLRKLIKRPTKKLHERTWMICLDDKVTGRKWCFEWSDGKIVPVKKDLIL